MNILIFFSTTMTKKIKLILFFTLTSIPALSQQNVSKIEFNSQKGYYVIQYSNSDSTVLVGTIMPNDNVRPIIHASVLRIESNSFQYRYEIKNDSLALQPLYRFSIPILKMVNDIDSPNSDWFGRFSQRINRVSWSKVRSNIPGIIPGNTEKYFSYKTKFPPSIINTFSENTYWSSFPNEQEGPFGVLDFIIDSLTTDGIKKMSLGPWLPDSSLSLEAFTDTLETFRFRSCEELNWATDATVCGELEDDLSDIKANLQAGDSLSAANFLSDFLELVEQEKDESLTSEGYALLFFNAEYLAERLPEPRIKR